MEDLALRPAWLWTGRELLRRPVIARSNDGRWSFEARGLPVQDVSGIVLPGLVNAHTHLELSAVETPRQAGMIPWVGALRAGAPPSEARARANVAVSWTLGTALTGDVTNTGQSRAALMDGPLGGVVFHEVLGIDVLQAPDVEGLSPHAPHSTHPALICAAAERAAKEPSRRWSIHCDEDPEERAFLAAHQGGWPGIMRALGRDLGAFPPPGCTPVAHLEALGVLSPQALLVHLTLTRGEDLDRVARTGARAVLCPRSNLHITGRLPDAEGILARGIPLALGTDSLASCPDLDVLAEAACARERFPEVPPARWLEAITAGGAEVLGVAGMGIVEEGTAAPLLHVEIPETETPVERLLDGTRWRRSWL